MDAQIKKRWVKALKSGEYAQGLHFMCKSDEYGAEYCPLGVLIEVVYGENIWVRSEKDNSLLQPKGQYTDFPSNKFLKTLRLDEEAATLISELNDIKGIPFPKIAEFIEENVF